MNVKEDGKTIGNLILMQTVIVALDLNIYIFVLEYRASLVAQLVNNSPAMQETWVQSLGCEDPWRRERLPTPVFWPGEFHGLYNPWGAKSWTQLNDFHFHFLALLRHN